MNGKENPRTPFWKSLSKLDWLAVGLWAGGVWAASRGGAVQSWAGMGLLRFLGLLSAFYLLYRFWTNWRTQVLWSLRNRLIVAYLFIAVVPILLLLSLASIAGQILYSQLAAYLLYHDIEDRVELLTDSVAHLAAAERTLPASMDERTLEEALAAQVEIVEGKRLPGLRVNFDANPEYFHAVAGTGARAFSGLGQAGHQL